MSRSHTEIPEEGDPDQLLKCFMSLSASSIPRVSGYSRSYDDWSISLFMEVLLSSTYSCLSSKFS